MLKHSIILSFLFCLIFNDLNAQNDLSITSVIFPDTVNLGETVLLKGYVLNQGNSTFNSNNFNLNLDIETSAPTDLLADNEVDEFINLDSVNIQSGDSIYFEKYLLIDSVRFEVQTIDLVVIWPMVNNTTNINNSANVRLAYVCNDSLGGNFTDFSFLPQAILDYLDLNYPGEDIIDVETDQTNYEIYLSNGLELTFTLNGVLIEIEIEYPTGNNEDNEEEEEEEDGEEDDDDGEENDEDGEEEEEDGEEDDEDGEEDDDDGEEDDEDGEDDDEDGEDDDDQLISIESETTFSIDIKNPGSNTDETDSRIFLSAIDIINDKKELVNFYFKDQNFYVRSHTDIISISIFTLDAKLKDHIIINDKNYMFSKYSIGPEMYVVRLQVENLNGEEIILHQKIIY